VLATQEETTKMENFIIGNIEVKADFHNICFIKKVKGVSSPKEYRLLYSEEKGNELLMQEIKGKKFQKLLHRQLAGRKLPFFKERLQRVLDSKKRDLAEKARNLEIWQSNCLINPEKNIHYSVWMNKSACTLPCGYRLDWMCDEWDQMISELNGKEISYLNENLISQIMEIEKFKQSKINPFKKVTITIE
jgi:hypothetical protein